QREDLDVEAERPVRDVVVVPLHTLGKGCLAAQPVHLGPAGDARLDAMAVAVAGDVAREQLHELGPLRPGADQAHLALEHVEQLRELVERAAAQEAPDRGAAILPLHAPRRSVAAEQEFQRARAVLLRRRLAGGEAHRAKLVEVEGLAVAPYAALAE